MFIKVINLLSVEVFCVKRGLEVDLEGVDVCYTESFLPDISIEFAGKVYGEVGVYLDVVFGESVLWIFGRIDNEISVAYSDVFLEEIYSSVVLIAR